MSLRFGTSGLRGLVSDLIGRPTVIYTTAFARRMIEAGYAKPGDAMVVGRDLRADSPAIARDCMQALVACGVVPIDCGALPTPALALYAMSRDAAGIMVTGSHIPADRNGIKFYRPDGEIDKTDEARIVAIADSVAAAPLPELSASVMSSGHDAAIQLFRARYRGLLPARSLKDARIGVYEHSSVGRDLLSEMLAGFGAEIVRLGRSEKFIPIDTEAVSEETIGQLRQWAREHALDVIVSADGDADRPLVADAGGEPLRGDLIGVVTAAFLQAETVVTPVTSNSRIADDLGFKVIRTRVGSPYVVAGMQGPAEDGAKRVMGFEANGGVLLATPFEVNGKMIDALPTRDAFLPVVAVLGQSLAMAKPVAELRNRWPLAAAASGRVEHFPTAVSDGLLSDLGQNAESLADFFAPIGTIRSVDTIDGLRVTFATGDVVHLRASGNAPEMRCYVEADDPARAGRLLEQGLGLIEDYASKRGR